MVLDILLFSQYLTSEDIKELNTMNQDCHFTKSEHLGYVPLPPEVVFLFIEFLKNIGYNGCYDLLKMAILSIVSKIEHNNKKVSSVLIVLNDKRYELKFSYDLTNEQKEKLVDAAIEYLLKQ